MNRTGCAVTFESSKGVEKQETEKNKGHNHFTSTEGNAQRPLIAVSQKPPRGLVNSPPYYLPAWKYDFFFRLAGMFRSVLQNANRKKDIRCRKDHTSSLLPGGTDTDLAPS